MNFRQLLAKYVTGNLRSDQFSAIGIAGLAEGLDTPHLRILAGLGKSENLFEVEAYLKTALEELKISLPDKRQATIEYLLAIADSILTGERDLFEGVRDMCATVTQGYGWFPSSDYFGDSIGFERIYGLFYDLDGQTMTKHFYLTKEEQARVVAQETEMLFEELKAWRKKMKSNYKKN